MFSTPAGAIEIYQNPISKKMGQLFCLGYFPEYGIGNNYNELKKNGNINKQEPSSVFWSVIRIP